MISGRDKVFNYPESVKGYGTGWGQAKVGGTCWSLVIQEEAAEKEEDWIQRTCCWHGSQEKTGFTYRREISLCGVKLRLEMSWQW